MKKYKMVVGCALALCLIGCANDKKANVPAEEQTQDMGYSAEETQMMQEVTVDRSADMKAQVQRIYDEIIPLYLTPDSPDGSQLEERYCSEGWIELNRKATKLANAMNDIGPIDWDMWIMAQDCDKSLSAKVTEGQLLSNEYGIVTMELTNFGKQKTMRFRMKFEHGTWKVDDIQAREGDEWSKSCRKYLEDYIK